MGETAEKRDEALMEDTQQALSKIKRADALDRNKRCWSSGTHCLWTCHKVSTT